MLFLCNHFPKYGQYKVWKGLAIIAMLAGLILLFFSWQIAIAVIVIGLGLNLYCNTEKYSSGKKFTEEIKQELNSNSSMGMAKICSHYIAGTIQLASQDGRAHWPAYTSSVFGGEVKFIQA